MIISLSIKLHYTNFYEYLLKIKPNVDIKVIPLKLLLFSVKDFTLTVNNQLPDIRILKLLRKRNLVTHRTGQESIKR